MISWFALAAFKPFDFYSFGPYELGPVRPEATLGYGPGDRHTTFREQEAVLRAIVGGSARTKVIEFGKSVEGRPLKVIAISSPKNIARLSEIQASMRRIANPKSAEDVNAAKANLPAIVWINECIHGNETASFESAMWLTYNLVASRSYRIETALNDVVVMVNPVYNPDGHERYVVYYNSIATGSSDSNAFERYEPGTVYGRYNHYRFDMNRDRVAMSQPETRQEVAEFLKWNPQVYVDQHGQVETYFFPPNAMSQNPNVDRERINKWTEAFGRATARAFDKQGFLYYVKDVFDLYYPGYLDSWTTLSGAIGMTHETDGGRLLAQERPDGSILTLRKGIEKHFTSAIAVILEAARRKDDLLNDYAKFKLEATSGKSAGKFQRVALSGDPRALERFRAQLERHGIRSAYLTQPWSGSMIDFWTGREGSTNLKPGSLIIDLAQPQGALAKALLEPSSNFEAKFVAEQRAKKKTAPEGEKYPGPDNAEFYDMTGWALPYAHNLDAFWSEATPALSTASTPPTSPSPVADSAIGYAIEYTDDADALTVIDALSAGLKASTTTKPMTLNGHTYPVGTFLFLAERNDDGYRKSLDALAAKRHARLVPLPGGFPDVDRFGPGGESVKGLRKPKIAIVFGSQASLGSVGPIWYLFEQVFKIPFAPISQGALNGDISDYTCIIVPGGTNASGARVKEWVSNGGCLVALDDINWAIGGSNYVSLREVKGEFQSVPGSLFRAKLDPRSFLADGYRAHGTGDIEIAAPVNGSKFFETRKEGGSAVTFSSDEKATKLLTGWAWPDETEKALRGTTWLQDVPVGRGRVVLFTQDPSERAMWPGLYKLLLNAVLIGPR